MTNQSNEACAHRLGKLADDPRFSSRAEDLRALAADIWEPDGDQWSGANLFSAFPAESVVRLRHRNWVERVAGVLAGISVFLPVGWTWWAFHDASQAYERMLSQDGEKEGTTFLAMWATGFDGRLSGSHLLVPTALWSLRLIILAILFLVLHRVVAGVNVRREEDSALETQAELASALTQAQIILDARRADHPLRIEGIVKSSMEKLNEAHKATRKAVGALSDTSERVSHGLNDMVLALAQAGTHAGEVIDKAKEANATLQSTLTQTEAAVTSSMTRLDGSVASNVELAQTAMTSSGRQLAEGLDAALLSFERSMTSTLESLRNDTVTEVARAGTALQEVVEHIGASAESNASAASRLADQVASMADDSSAAREEMTHTIGEVRSAIEGVESALLRHGDTLQGQIDELTRARDAAERMLRRLMTNGADLTPSPNGLGA